jgi:alkylation response protein AidB-like acyl-CoA dehydrogenase
MTNTATAAAIAADHATETERLGYLHPAVVDALTGAGLFRLWVPPEYGGPGATIAEGIEEIIAMGRADGATGWCVMIANTTALAAYHLRPDWAEKIYADPFGCTGGFGMPSGSAVVVDGGLRVSGTWAWGSGTDHCTWIGGGVQVIDAEGQPSATPDGATTPFVFFDPGDVDLLDTWQVAGLRGTASTDYAVDDAFVPDGRWAQFVGGTPYLEGPATRFSFFGGLACGVAAVTIGLAQRAVDELIALGARHPSGSRRSLAERGAIQADLASARGNAAQARSYLLHTATEAWEQASAGRQLDDQMRIDLRLAATTATRRSLEAVDLCYHAGGGTAVYSLNPLQRVFRDAHVACQHAMVAPRTLEPLGRHAFGLPTSMATL